MDQNTALLQQKITRKEFLLLVGSLLLALSGVAHITNTFQRVFSPSSAKESAFGGGPYGGR